MIDFLEVLYKKRELLWPEVKKYLDGLQSFPDCCQIPDAYHDLVKFHAKMLREYPERRGKYVRPSLVLLVASAMGFPEKNAVKTAVAMQMSEEWILMHDDIEDDSLQRRGGSTLHQTYGKELAINAGDGLHVLMWKILRDNEKAVGTAKTLEIMDEFYQMLNRTVFGQTIEIKWIQENRLDLEDEDVLLILESKTGYYTIAGPMRLGAILAGATKTQLDKLYEFGKLSGYCYQIRDDLLDLTSDFGGLKKQTGNDIYEGKRTIMLVHLLRNIKGADKEELLSIIKKIREQKNEKEVRWVIEMMKKYGSLVYGQEMLKKFAAKAKGYFNNELDFIKNQPARKQLIAFINFLEKRDH